MRAVLVFSICLLHQVIFAQPESPRRKFADVLAEFSRSPEFQATQSTIRSIELDFATRDLILQPQLELAAKRINEQRMFLSGSANKNRTENLSALLTKPFSTGTTLKVIPSFERANVRSLDPS